MYTIHKTRQSNGIYFALIPFVFLTITAVTEVAFDFSGNVSVNISHRDYMEYKESLAFDQLCTSLANLFVEFIAMHQRGEGVRIMDRLDAVNISWYAYRQL